MNPGYLKLRKIRAAQQIAKTVSSSTEIRFFDFWGFSLFGVFHFLGFFYFFQIFNNRIVFSS